MKRTLLTDPYFYNQPPMTFIDDLKLPLHQKAPDYYGKRPIDDGEIDVHGLYIAEKFSDDPENLLETIYKDFSLFLSVYKIGGSNFPIYLKQGETECFEAYIIEVSEDKVTITANDTEGIRRGLIYLEDELRRSENAYLMPGTTRRKPFIKQRITRCFFSPINRPPKNGDELSDDIDYYPEEYLNRIMHDGANGVWIYTRFMDILPSSIIKEYGKGYEKRIAKLNRVIEKCKRYGIGVYLMAIEPVAIGSDIVDNYLDMVSDTAWNGNRYFCCSSERGKAYCYEAGKKLLELCPGLRGHISITYGERPTACADMIRGHSDYGAPNNPCTCPRCKDKKPGEILSLELEALRSGAREVNPEFETVSWTYSHRNWEYDDIFDYVDTAPDDVVLMQNFEDRGFEDQLGKRRYSGDYWLSYPGPSEMFTKTAERARANNKTMWAKMQVCCSHEIATVPYVSAPGLVFDKYKGAFELGVTGVMQCWYFGNYPSLMSKVAGEMSFASDFNDKDAALEKIAGIYFGRTKAKEVVKVWKLFEAGYRNFPLNIMFSYYGPMHDSVVWKLSLKPKNLELARTWQLVDPPDGDRIYDCLLTAHTLDEAYTLCDIMRNNWQEGMKLFENLTIEHPEESEQFDVAKAIGILFDGGTNILEFYKLRDLLGRQAGDAKEILSRMRELVELEIKNSEKMIPLCESCKPLGYHSEAEGFKFFPEKILERINQLRTLLETEFVEVENRIAEGKSPLEYYDGVEEHESLKRYSMIKGTLDDAKWENIDDDGTHKFRMAYEGKKLYIELLSHDKDALFLVCPEFRLTVPDANLRFNKDGFAYFTYHEYFFNQMLRENADAELFKYRNIEVLDDAGVHLKLTLDIDELGLDRIRPMKMKFKVDEESWCTCTREVAPHLMPAVSLGKNYTVPDEFGWIIPE